MSHRANRKTVKKLIQVRRGVEHEVPSSEDSDDDAVVPPSTPPRVKRLSDDSKVDTGISQLSSVAFQTPTVVHSPCLTETPKRIKKSSPPKHELPVFALPSAAHDSSLQSNAIVKEVSASTISAAKAPPDVSTPHLPAVVHDMQPLSPTNAVGDEVSASTISDSESSISSPPVAVYEQEPPPAVDEQQPPPPVVHEQQPPPPAVGAIVGATLVKALATAAVVAVVAAGRQKLDDFIRNCVYVMATGTLKKIWMKNAHPPHSVDVFSTYCYTCDGQLAECTVFGPKASTFQRVFR